MTKILAPLLAACVLAAPCFADVVIVQEMSMEGAMKVQMEMTMKIKGSKFSMTTGQMGGSIIDTETGDVITLMHAQKQYMKIPGAQIKAMTQNAMKNMGNATTKPEIKATGNKEKINGYDTEEYTVTGPVGGEIHLWIAKNYPNGKKLLEEMQKMSKGAFAKGMPGQSTNAMAYENLPGFPLRTVVNQGGQKIVMNVKSVEEKSLPDSDFQPPADYKEMSMPAMSMPAPAAP